MKKSDFHFDLPENLIAQTPLLDRSSSRMLVLNKQTGEITHTNFKEIVNYLKKGDCIVLNDTKVLPARLYGRIFKNNVLGASGEILLLKKLTMDTWEAIVKPGKKLREGSTIIFDENPENHSNPLLKGEILEVLDNGNRIIKFSYDKTTEIFENILDKLGEMPLPHYIKEKLSEKSRYQTVYAENDGSAAAPTAGLHFTNEILDLLKEKGVFIAKVTLHVGLGTFRPVKAENILEHEMHSEYFEIEEEQANIINNAKQNGGKIIAIGTTSCRTLESSHDKLDFSVLKSGNGDTNIFIYPGYEFKMVDSLLTNFHLPESTLIMLVSSLCGHENTMNAYNEAVKNGYRFFSFGDSMLII